MAGAILALAGKFINERMEKHASHDSEDSGPDHNIYGKAPAQENPRRDCSD